MKSFLNRITRQTAVYWGNPKSDGFGGLVYDDGIEIKCRWEDVHEIVKNANAKTAKEVIAKGKIITIQDVKEEGYLYLGNLSDLDSDPAPKNTEESHQIINVKKIPIVNKTNEFIREVLVQ